MTWIDLYLWTLDHVGTLILLGLVIFGLAYIIGAGVYALACAKDEREQQAQIQRLETQIGLSSEQRSKLPPPLGARPPRPRKQQTVRASGLASERKVVS